MIKVKHCNLHVTVFALLISLSLNLETWGSDVFSDSVIDNLMELLDVQDKRLARLEQGVENAELEFDSQVNAHWHVYEWLEARIIKVIGTGCGESQFQCHKPGSAFSQCVTNLLVCDGTPDCANGRDEDDYVCENLVTLESSWTGSAQWTACVNSGPINIKMFVTSLTRLPYFASRIEINISAVVELPWSETGRNALMADGWGYYYPGQRRLEIFPVGMLRVPQVEDLFLTCSFDDSDHTLCAGHIVKSATGVRCAAVTLYHN